MSVTRLPPGAVLLSGAGLELVRYAVETTVRVRRVNGLPPSLGLQQLADALAVPGQPDSPDESPRDPGFEVDCHEASRMLGVSERTARRLAPKLGGRRVGGRWLLDRQAIRDHLEGTQP